MHTNQVLWHGLLNQKTCHQVCTWLDHWFSWHAYNKRGYMSRVESVLMHATKYALDNWFNSNACHQVWITNICRIFHRSTQFVNNYFNQCFLNHSKNHFEQNVIFREHERWFFRQVIKSDIKTHLNKKTASISSQIDWYSQCQHDGI